MEEGDRAVQAWLAEHASIRAEIQGRSDRQWVIVQVYAAAAVALLGFCISDLDSRWAVLFVIPVAAVATALLFWDHHIVISGLAEYERDRLRQKVRELTKEPEALGWEDFRRSKWAVWPRIQSSIGMLLLWLGPLIAVAITLGYFASSGSDGTSVAQEAEEPGPTPPPNAKYIPPPDIWPAVDYTEDGSPIVADELLVKFKDNVPEEEREAILSEVGAQTKKISEYSGIRLVKVDPAQREQILKELSSNENIEIVEPNQIAQLVD